MGGGDSSWWGIGEEQSGRWMGTLMFEYLISEEKSRIGILDSRGKLCLKLSLQNGLASRQGKSAYIVCGVRCLDILSTFAI